MEEITEEMWRYVLERVEDHLRSHGRGVYLEMENVFWTLYCGLPLQVSCSECGFSIVQGGVPWGRRSEGG